MRMWMCDSKILCQKHLCGNHVEDHMLLSSLRKKIKFDGYIKNNLFEPLSLQQNHNELAEEMKRRGYKHNSDLDFSLDDIKYLNEQTINFTIDKNISLKELLRRCPNCKKRFDELNN